MNGENEYIGFLEVVVRTVNGALPLEGALVSIYEYTQKDESAQRGALLYSLETDENGRTPKIALPTKDKKLSQSYGNENPYATYNISVAKDGYYNSSYVNTPVFQGITSIQPVSLIPLSEYASPNDYYPNASRRYVETPSTDL